MSPRRYFALALVLGGIAACRDTPAEPPPGEPPVPVVASASAAETAAAPTIDVRKGRETAFGLQLPRGARLRTGTPASKTFEVPLSQLETVAFLRARLSGVTQTDGGLATTLEGSVIAASRPAQVIVVVREATLSSEVTVRLEASDDATPEPSEPVDAPSGPIRNPDAIEGEPAVDVL